MKATDQRAFPPPFAGRGLRTALPASAGSLFGVVRVHRLHQHRQPRGRARSLTQWSSIFPRKPAQRELEQEFHRRHEVYPILAIFSRSLRYIWGYGFG